MRYTDWINDYENLKKEVDGIPLIDIQEVLSVGGNHAVVCLGKKTGIFIDDQDTQPRFMRSWWTEHREEFIYLMESLKDKVREQKQFAIDLCNAMTEQAVPDLVLKRMRGEQVSGDAFTLLKDGVKYKISELEEELVALSPPRQFTFTFNDDVAGQKLRLGFTENRHWKVMWWGLHSGDAGTDLEACMYLLANFSLIRKRCQDIATQIREVK